MWKRVCSTVLLSVWIYFNNKSFSVNEACCCWTSVQDVCWRWTPDTRDRKRWMNTSQPGTDLSVSSFLEQKNSCIYEPKYKRAHNDCFPGVYSRRSEKHLNLFLHSSGRLSWFVSAASRCWTCDKRINIPSARSFFCQWFSVGRLKETPRDSPSCPAGRLFQQIIRQDVHVTQVCPPWAGV